MAFRTIEISKPAELHIEKNQLLVKQETGVARIPIEDILHITCLGPNIRLSTLALSKLSEYGITLMTVDEKYNASSISFPIKGHSRQSMVIHKQIDLMGSVGERHIWQEIIRAKIMNQISVLEIRGNITSGQLNHIPDCLCMENTDECESMAAKKYFQALFPGLNRREECPFNSRLNYGYAVVRNSIIRSLMNKGFQPAIGLHHSNQLNAFNLADDIIEPFRPIVDLVALNVDGGDVVLSTAERRKMAGVLHTYCELNGKKEKVIVAIDHVLDQLKEYICCSSESERMNMVFGLPIVIPLENSVYVEE